MARNKHARLKADGEYTGDHGMICGYSDYASKRKEQFLHDATALLREVGKRLAQHGLTQMEVRRNPAGIAVSGEVTAEYWQPDNPYRHVWIEIGTSSLTMLSGRKDGVCILARVQEYRDPTEKERQSSGRRNKNGKPDLLRCAPGPNQWLSPAFDSRELADALLKIYTPEHSPQAVAVHTVSRGTLPIPSPIVNNEAEATAWVLGNQAVQEAFQADQQVGEARVPIQIDLFSGTEQVAEE